MRKPLWTPSKERIMSSKMYDYMQYVNKKYNKDFRGYRELYGWSVTEVEDFWASIWDYMGIVYSKPYTKVVDDLKHFPGAEWFPGARLNYAENILKYSDKPGVGIVVRGENQIRKEYTRREVYELVVRLAEALRKQGVKPGEVVAAYMPNIAETVIAMLATNAVGAIWCSCATDIGPLVAVDRIGQVKPKILITVDGYYYKGRQFDVLHNVKEIKKAIPSLEKVVVVHFGGNDDAIDQVPDSVRWEDFLTPEVSEDFHFEQMPANAPVVIMFSSGTTGKPKCMVQSAAGLLVNQLKELVLHSNICEGETLLYITTCSWMMWNWQAAALGTGAKVVLFDGNPSYPDNSAIWKVLEEEKVTVFGLSASYIHGLMAAGFSPKKAADLSALKSISQTGSALSEEGFEFVYSDIKEDLHFNSIAGGTDINGCFAIGCPILPVYSGELQNPGLGMKIKCYDENGKPVLDEQGELVCECPAPSMPIKFWNDSDGSRYHDAYFDVYPGIWRHGDYVLIHSDTGGITFYGRSDSILKPSGVRIGTAEIYNQVDKIPEVEDSIAIGQNYHGDQRVILFVKMKDGYRLDDKIIKNIKTTLRVNASPRHVPAVIMEAPDLPITLNGKKVESAVTNIINGRKVTNRNALANPDSLDFFVAIKPALEK